MYNFYNILNIKVINFIFKILLNLYDSNIIINNLFSKLPNCIFENNIKNERTCPHDARILYIYNMENTNRVGDNFNPEINFIYHK